MGGVAAGAGGGIVDHAVRAWLVGSVSIADDEASVDGDAGDVCPVVAGTGDPEFVVPAGAADGPGESGGVLCHREWISGDVLLGGCESGAGDARANAVAAALYREGAAH